MGWFASFREGSSNTFYSHNRHPVELDWTEFVIVYLSVTTSAAFLVLVVGIRGKERWKTLTRLIVSLQSGVIILVCIFGHGWQKSEISSSVWYSYNHPSKIMGKLGINIGLKTINITLKADLKENDSMTTVEYNEQFTIDKVSDMAREYDRARMRGLPWPILTVVEYLAVDGGGLVWMRGLHEAGHMTFILLWCSFVMWAAGIVLVSFVVSRGSLLWAGSGALMIISCITYSSLLSETPLKIHFENQILSMSFGWSFWLVIVSGLISFVVGITIFLAHLKCPIYCDQMLLIDTTDLSDEPMDDLPNGSPGPLLLPTPFSNRRRASMPALHTTFSNPSFTTTDEKSPRKATKAQRRSMSVCEGMPSVSFALDTTDIPNFHPHSRASTDSEKSKRAKQFTNILPSSMTSIEEENEAAEMRRMSALSDAGTNSDLRRSSDIGSSRPSDIGGSNVTVFEIPASTKC